MSDEIQKNLESSEVADAALEHTEAGDELVDHMSEEMTMTAEQGAEETTPEESVPDTQEEEVLEEERVKDEIDIQIDLLKDSDWVVRREAVITLGEMGDERCVEPVVKALRDGDWQVREAAIEACGNIGSPAVEGLIRYLRDWDVRKYAILAMGKIRDERVLDPLIQQLRNDEFKDYATDALVELGQPAVEKLLVAMKDKDELVRNHAIIALGRIRDTSAVDALIEMLNDKDWFTRIQAAAALEQVHDDRCKEAIKPLLKDPDEVVRMRAERIIAGWKKRPEPATA
jgi:HEAT repeat protein